MSSRSFFVEGGLSTRMYYQLKVVQGAESLSAATVV
jgi:hypothetical protein